jgi:hypothetical protein
MPVPLTVVLLAPGPSMVRFWGVLSTLPRVRVSCSPPLMVMRSAWGFALAWLIQ